MFKGIIGIAAMMTAATIVCVGGDYHRSIERTDETRRVEALALAVDYCYGAKCNAIIAAMVFEKYLKDGVPIKVVPKPKVEKKDTGI